MPADGKPDGYEIGSRCGFPCSANESIMVSPGGVVSGCSNIPITFGNLHNSSLREVILSPERIQMLQADQKQAFPQCGSHDYCRYCQVPCLAGERLRHHEDGSFTIDKTEGDECRIAMIRMELCRQIQQGLDPLDGKTVRECLSTLPTEEVPVFCKKIKI